MAEGFNTEDMLDVYLYENGQLLENLQEIVLDQKDAESFDDDSINEIFRTMHTIKGSSGIMMFDNITNVAHKLEDIFYFLRESHPKNVPHITLVGHVLDVADFITTEMEKIENGGTADGDSSEIIGELDKFLQLIKVGNNDAVVPENVHTQPQQFYIAPKVSNDCRFFKIYITFQENVELVNVHAYKAVHSLKEIAEDLLHSPEDVISDESSSEKILKDGFKILLKTQKTKEDIEKIVVPGYDIKKVDIFECTEKEFKMGFESFQEEKQDKPIAPGDFVIESKDPGKRKVLAKDKPRKAEKTSYISVDIHKMDMLMDLIGELVISESVVLQNPDLKVPGLRLDNFNKAAAQMTKISTDLQNVIMSMRMVQLSNTFQKMNRIVFDVSRKLGKNIDFEMHGETTEVDKNIIEHISDPLMHLVRNAVDHGIETNEEREAAHKTEKAKITLSAKTESGKVWITVTDNGKGLDRNVLLNKARSQGLLEYGKPDSSYTDKEVYQFITLPGFSTKEKITEYSGRGVGMDVVVSNLQKVGGSLEIDSKKGEGSSMCLKIPLTLAIIDGIVMEVGNLSFVVETGMVKEFVGARDHKIIKDPDNKEYVMIRGECYPVLRLGEWYEISSYQQNDEEGMFIILEMEKKRICLLVDRLIGKQEIVVKPIPDYITKVKGLSGCTQLGDGSIALILDTAGLVNE